MADAGADEEGDAGSAKAGERGGDNEGAGAELSGILLGQSKSIDSKVSSAQSKKKQTNKKPGEGARFQIKNFAEGERDENHHEGKENRQGSAATDALRKPRHGEAAENGGKRNQHDSPRRELSGVGASTAAGLRRGRDSRRGRIGSRPKGKN